MINRVCNFHNSINSPLNKKVIFSYNVSVGINAWTHFVYSVNPDLQKIVNMNYNSEFKLINKVFTFHSNIEGNSDNHTVIVRKNDGD